MGNPFGNAVICMLNDMKSPPWFAYRLMMGAVGNHMAAIEFCKKGIRPYQSGMYFIIPIPGMPGGFRDMLQDVSPEKNIDNLHSLTDAQYGLFPFYKMLQGLQLYDIQFRIDIFGAMVFLAEKCRRNISAAGQQEAMEIGKATGIHRDGKRYPHFL